MVVSQRARLAVFVFKFCLFLALFLCAYICFALMGNVLGVFRPVEVVAPLGVPGFSPAYSLSFIIDPGHGGEDAGALASDGTKEKDINLAIARHLGDFLHYSGTEVLFTRQEDVLLDYPDAPNKKSGDLMARVSVSKNSPHSVFVSLHMNKFPQERYHGLQVFYSHNHPQSQLLAQSIQENAALYLQPDNHREPKCVSHQIYVLDRIQAPAVLIECGFLSNPQELALLKNDAYLRRMAFVLSHTLLQNSPLNH